jgi:tetratricopeptide (TPR) repeat protein
MRDKSCYSASSIKRYLTILSFTAILNLFPGIVPCSAAEDLYESRLDEGLFNTEPYSYLLISLSHQEKEMSKALLDKARLYSPDLPAVYFELAGESFTPSANGVFQWFDYFRQGMKAYGRNFWWGFSIQGTAYVSLLISFILSLVAILAIRLPMEAGLILHDTREEGKLMTLLAIPVFLSLLGMIALIAGMFFLAGLYFRRENKVLAYVSFLFFLLSPFLLREVTPFLTSPSPLKAIVAVNEGKDNKLALWALRGRSDFASSFSYALALKREGDYQGAIDAYKSLAERLSRPDPRLYINLGNAYYGMKDMGAAGDAYLKSVEISPLPSAYYNLSQIHREMLDFSKGDEYFLNAAKLNPDAVSRYAALSGSSPNRFVVDEPLPDSVIWEYTRGSAESPLSGLQFFGSFIALLMIAGFYILDRRVRYRAQRCKRCGSVFCSRCSRIITWGEMCPRCFGSLVKIDEVDSKERIARLLSIYQSQMKRRNRAKLLSCLVPGAGQIYSGKLLAGLLFLWPFLFGGTLIVMNYSPLAGIFPFNHAWITPLMLIVTGLAYLGSVLHIRRRIQKGWL